MDHKEYIASGIIERYVLGSVSDQERREVECMSSIYPELKEELLKAQYSIESYVESIAVEPPKELKVSILEAIKNVKQDKTIQMIPIQAEKEQEEEEEKAKIVPMRPIMKWAVAATLIPVIGFGMMYFGERNTRIDLSDQLANVEQRVEARFKDSLSSLGVSLEENKAYQALILDESTTEVLLAGTDVSPESQVRVFWSAEKQEYMLVSDRLPTPISGKQYQLWAIADGVPVDLGVLDKSAKIKSPSQINLENIQAFAITLEKDGGNPTPTMDQMYVVSSQKLENKIRSTSKPDPKKKVETSSLPLKKDTRVLPNAKINYRKL